MKTILASNKSFWVFYDWILKLKNEGYIVSVGGSDWYPPMVWQLTKKGFDSCLSDLGELSERRFKPHSIPHDAWVFAFQMGDYIHGTPDCVSIITEQQFRCFDESLHPKWLPKDKTHIPDGFTRVKYRDKTLVFGLEVELNAKPIERYDEIFNYYDDIKSVGNVLWLIGTSYVKSRMLERLEQIDVTQKQAHNFIYLDDFKKHGWNAVVNHGRLLNHSIKNLMLPTSVLPQSYSGPTAVLPNSIEIFLSTKRSPKKTLSCSTSSATL